MTPWKERVDAGLRFGDGDAGLEPREEVDPIIAAVVESFPSGLKRFAHADGNEDIRNVSDSGAFEAFGSYADDGHRNTVDEHLLIDDGGIAIEVLRPVRVAENHDAPVAGGLVVIGCDEAAGGRD